MSALAERYAEATWRLAKTPEVGDRLVQEIVAFLAALDASAPLRQVLHDPTYRKSAPKVLRALISQAKASPLCGQLLGFLHARGRLALLYDIGWALARRVDRAAGRLRAHVTSAAPLGKAEVASLEAALAKRFGKPVVADLTLDKALLGGFVCRIGRLTFDASLKRHFAQFAERVASLAT